jgi:pantoate--beta-alanine ligase
MRKVAISWKNKGWSIALVPTMGFFHQGHLSLMGAARSRADRIVVSIFVNPAQFGPGEDLDRYPRDLERDLKLAEKERVDCVFSPDSGDIYPDGFQTWITVRELSKGLCGISRPQHFSGVATIVAKLFNIVQPDIALFGRKDFQQLQIIRRMVSDLNMPVQIIDCPIVREPNGLAMSSRNKYLDPKDREAALSLFQALMLADKMVNSGCKSGSEIMRAVRDHIQSFGNTEIDYIFLGDPESLNPCRMIVGKTLLALAVWVGNTRLIDNILLNR